MTGAGGGLTRRRVLGLAGAGGVLVLTGGLPGCAPDAPGPVAAPKPELRDPDVVTSAGGRLDVELVAAPAYVPYGAGDRWALTYNGSSPGPTWRVRPGDVVTVTLVNELDEPTNLHTHGLHVSPTGAGDDPFVMVDPGGRHTYRYEIPADHRSGLFWYHPHHHGMVAGQVGAGLAGAIVVVDALDDLPALAAAPDRVLVLNDPRLGATSTSASVTPMDRMAGREGDAVLLNGLRQPRLSVPAGSLARWRLLNASPSRYYALALDGHPLHVIAGDGGRLERPRVVNELILTPGERAEVLVAVGRAGTYRLTTRAVPRGSTMMGDVVSSATGPITVATVEVTGPERAAPALPAALAPVVDLAATPATRTREVVLSMAMGGMGGGGMGGMGPGGMGGGGMGGMMDGQFRIDGRTYEAGRVDIATSVGDVEDWVVRNTSSMDHPFHLHTWPFQVLARSDGSTPEPEWKDTVNVPADSWVRIRIPFQTYGGRTLYHCHILDHEDLGMMGTIEVT